VSGRAGGGRRSGGGQSLAVANYWVIILLVIELHQDGVTAQTTADIGVELQGRTQAT